jgi:hypothetical protein
VSASGVSTAEEGSSDEPSLSKKAVAPQDFDIAADARLFNELVPLVPPVTPPAVPPLLVSLVDDAALFPPGAAPMAVAVASHPGHRAAWYADVVGVFLCPSSRLAEMRNVLPPDDRIDLGLIADQGIESLAAALAEVMTDPRLVLRKLEIDVAPERVGSFVTLGALELLPVNAEVYVELPATPAGLRAIEVLHDVHRGAKLRTGGRTASAFPTVQEVAAFISTCVANKVPFKCTAGLHRAIRHTDASSGFVHHGFLNILAATARAVDGASQPDIAEAIASPDATRLAAELSQLQPDAVRLTRSAFRAYGSCSVEEPVTDLLDLGLLIKG